MPALANAVARVPQYTPTPSEAAPSPADNTVGHQCFSGGGGGGISGGSSIFGCATTGGGSGGGGFGSSTGGGGAGGVFGVASAFSFSNARRVFGLTGPDSS